MSNMQSLQRINLYVTYVEKEGPFLKLWGQTDKNNAIYVEQFLAGVASQFDLGAGKVSADTLPPGTLICAKYKDDKYYRAKILNNIFVREGFLEVSFIDFGNKDIVAVGAIRSLQNFPTSIISLPPLAVGFIFAEAHCVGGGEWNDTIFDSIVKEIKYREVQCTLLTQATNYYLVRISSDNSDLCSILLQRGLMQPISLQAQQAVLLSMSMQKQSNQTQAQSASNVSSGINTYKACTLEPGCQYPVYVSYVNDGPCHFSVQLKQTEDVLVMLMNDINSITLRLLEEVPIPGTICLARCQEDGNICRAVVTNEVDTQFKVFYVDFGNYEVLPLDALYQIPFKYVLPKVMAIRFSLFGVEKSTVTVDMQIAFKKFVDNRLLHMKVLPSPTRTALPKCELWDPETKTSALEVVRNSARHSYPEPMALTRGFSQPVKVSFVYSCSRFYVQLVNKESELSSLMEDLQVICQINEPLDVNSIKVGLPCCALFSGDNLWYRSQVVEVAGDSAKVRYIDYGNEESVPINGLKSIDGEILTVLRPQAIESCLNGYQNMEPDAERDGLLEELILEGVFTMKVVEMFDKKALVDLFDSSNYNVASLLLDKLAAAKSQVSPVLVVQAGNKIEHKKSYSQTREQNNYKGDRHFNTGRENKNYEKPTDGNEKSWRQDNRENRNYDKNTNENNDSSWRRNNKGFSPNNRLDKIRRPEDSWNATENTANHDDWNKPQKSPQSKRDWNNGNSNPSQNSWNSNSNDNWGTPANNEESRPHKRNDFKSNRGGYNNDRGGRYGGKPRDRDGGYHRKDFKKDGSELSSSGSEKSFHKGPRSSSRIDRGREGRGGSKFDKPRNSSFRRGGGGGGDSWNANTTTEDSWNVSAVTTSINAAPADAPFVCYDVVGSEGKIVISWFHNPGLFYCQQIEFQESFKTMMDEICDFYKDRKPEQVVKGAPAIALFEEDSVLYRARILDVIGTQYKVHYVDFGNVSNVTKVWPIEKKFMDLPAQAVTCSLNGVAPSSGQWLDPDSYSSYFDKASFVCCFVNKDEERNYVNIFHDSEDIAQLLIRDGLAVSTLPAVPEIELPLFLGQQFRATLKSVNNLNDIILMLECGFALNCTMHNLSSATETFEDVLKGLLEQAVIVYVDNVLEDYRLEITLYDIEGNKHIILDPDEGAFETVDLPCPMFVLRSLITGYVPYAEETTIFIQPNEYAELVTSLLDQLFELYDGKTHENTIIPEEGTLYAVHSEDGNWYRGRVISFDDEKATVTFIDYGNSEDVAFVELRELEPKFLEISVLSLQVTIPSGGDKLIDKEVTANIYYGESGWEGTAQLVDSSSTVLVNQAEGASDETSDTGFATSSMEKDQEHSSEDVVHVNEEIIAAETEAAAPAAEETVATAKGNLVFMSHIDSPSDFYLQFHETLSEIEALQAELQETVDDMEILENPAPGVFCAAPYSADQQWYRAEVLDADEDITTVRFVDFGNTDVIDNKSTRVKTLPPKLLSMAIYATRCSLKVQPVEEEWSSTALAVFEELTNSDKLTAEFHEQDEKCTYVELYVEDVNLKKALISEKLAKPVTNTTESKQTGFVSHLNSPSEFWIQLESCVDQLEWIAEQLSTAESFPDLEDQTPGTLCAALFPDDQMWYRARILSNTVAGIELLFVDYGNSCISASLKQLPEHLVVTSPLAMKCSLQKNEGIPTWSPEASAKFEEISADGQTIFTVKKISTGETSVVQLLLNDEDVTTMLLPSTEEGYIKDVESLEKLTIENEGGDRVEGVALEALEEQELDQGAQQKFEELNEQGTTKFQIEFVNERTVRLYLNGKDIRPLLGSFKDPSFNPLNISEDPLQSVKLPEDGDRTDNLKSVPEPSEKVAAMPQEERQLVNNLGCYEDDDILAEGEECVVEKDHLDNDKNEEETEEYRPKCDPSGEYNFTQETSREPNIDSKESFDYYVENYTDANNKDMTKDQGISTDNMSPRKEKQRRDEKPMTEEKAEAKLVEKGEEIPSEEPPLAQEAETEESRGFYEEKGLDDGNDDALAVDEEYVAENDSQNNDKNEEESEEGPSKCKYSFTEKTSQQPDVESKESSDDYGEMNIDADNALLSKDEEIFTENSLSLCDDNKIPITEEIAVINTTKDDSNNSISAIEKQTVVEDNATTEASEDNSNLNLDAELNPEQENFSPKSDVNLESSEEIKEQSFTKGDNIPQSIETDTDIIEDEDELATESFPVDLIAEENTIEDIKECLEKSHVPIDTTDESNDSVIQDSAKAELETTEYTLKKNNSSVAQDIASIVEGTEIAQQIIIATISEGNITIQAEENLQQDVDDGKTETPNRKEGTYVPTDAEDAKNDVKGSMKESFEDNDGNHTESSPDHEAKTNINISEINETVLEVDESKNTLDKSHNVDIADNDRKSTDRAHSMEIIGDCDILKENVVEIECPKKELYDTSSEEKTNVDKEDQNQIDDVDKSSERENSKKSNDKTEKGTCEGEKLSPNEEPELENNQSALESGDYSPKKISETSDESLQDVTHTISESENYAAKKEAPLGDDVPKKTVKKESTKIKTTTSTKSGKPTKNVESKLPLNRNVPKVQNVKKPLPPGASTDVSKESSKAVKKTVSPRNATKEVSKVAPTKDAPKTCTTKVSPTKSVDDKSPNTIPKRTSLCFPKVLGTPKDEGVRSPPKKDPIKKESLANQKEPCSKKETPSKVAVAAKKDMKASKKPVSEPTSPKKVSPKKENAEKKVMPEIMASEILDNVVDVACSGDKNDSINTILSSKNERKK